MGADCIQRILATTPRSLAGVSPFWIWMQVLIVICVIAGMIIAIVKLA